MKLFYELAICIECIIFSAHVCAIIINYIIILLNIMVKYYCKGTTTVYF